VDRVRPTVLPVCGNLARPYVFHARTHSAILANNVIHETARATHEVLQNIFSLVTNIATGTLILVSVMLLNPAIASAMIIALAGGYILIYLAVRNRLLLAGKIQAHFYGEQTKIVDESLGAIKDILVLRIQNFFRDGFERANHALARSSAHIELISKSPRHVMECVAVIGLVLLALLAGDPGHGIGSWLGQLTFLGFAAYRLLPTLTTRIFLNRENSQRCARFRESQKVSCPSQEPMPCPGSPASRARRTSPITATHSMTCRGTLADQFDCEQMTAPARDWLSQGRLERNSGSEGRECL